MNKDLLLKIKQTILERPKQFKMDWWFRKASYIPECGTAACIAGWALTLSTTPEGFRARPLDTARNLLPQFDVLETVGGGENDQVEPEAAKLLGLSPLEARKLFYCSYWPVKMCDDYEDAATAEDAAQVAARRIDRFINTNGEE